ncbi:hypothetical protein F4604DRAFT_1942574 [Suillus subluteus]|nr:hypothetical protein F4604DRAFT_1942574 [Suillus subluteus]
MGLCDGVRPSSVNGLTQIGGHLGTNHLKAFEVLSRLLFSPQLLPFAVQTIRSASLQKLCLSSVKLSPAHWDKLLWYLAIPTLVEFRADTDCAPSTLIRFLARHPAVTNLTIMPRPGNAWRTNQVNLHLTLSLSVLDGPLTHVLPVLRSHYNPPSLACLGVSLQADDVSPEYITTILQCVSCCNSVSYLMVSLPQSYSHSAMICPPGSHSAVRIEHMAINYSEASILGAGAAGDSLVVVLNITFKTFENSLKRRLDSFKLPAKVSADDLEFKWQNDRALTDTLVNYLVSKSTDCRVLFYSDGKKAMTAVDDHPSGLDKGQIYQNIAKLLFANHIGNRIGTYSQGQIQEIKVSFGSTGAGVMPAEGTQANNLLDAVLLELPWYTDLDSIWHSNPSMAAVTHSSKPGVDHAGALYSLVQPCGGAGPPTHFGSTHQWSPCAPPYPSHDTSLNIMLSAPAPVPPSAPTPAPPSAPPSPPSPPSPSHTAPYNMSPQFHLPGLPAPDYNFDYDNDDFNQEISGWFDAPLEDTPDHLDGDDMMVDGTTDCPPHVVGKKWQLPSSPSPPPDPPAPFHMPEKSSTSSYNSRSAFGSQKLSSHGG